MPKSKLARRTGKCPKGVQVTVDILRRKIRFLIKTIKNNYGSVDTV